MVRKGNPKSVKSLSDMTKPGIKTGEADREAAAIGRLLPRILKLNEITDSDWSKNVVMRGTTVNELAMAVKLGTIDAAVVWDAVAAKYRADSDIVTIPKNISTEVGAAVLKFSGNRVMAAKFLDFMTSKRGVQILRRNGYTVTPHIPQNTSQ
jgi:ABC-type molybdate transport system substrate-binding protein